MLQSGAVWSPEKPQTRSLGKWKQLETRNSSEHSCYLRSLIVKWKQFFIPTRHHSMLILHQSTSIAAPKRGDDEDSLAFLQ